MTAWPHDEERVYHWDGPPELDLWRARVVLPTGLAYTGHRLVTDHGRHGVVILPTCGDDLLLVHSPRPAADGDFWELPRGFGTSQAKGLTVVTADATRELAEETGYSSTTTVLLGEYVTDTALLPTRVSVVECVIAPDAIPAQTDAETSERRWVPLRRVRGMIAQGLLHDAHSLSALSFIADRWT